MSTAVQLSLFSETPPAKHASPGPSRVPPRSYGNNAERDIESALKGCPLGRNRCTVLPSDCEVWPSICF